MSDNPSFFEDYELIVAPNYDPRFTPAKIPLAGVFDPPTYMLCINANWWSHVIGVIDRLAQIDAWKSSTLDEKRQAVDSVLDIMNQIGQRIECGDMATFQLRQSPIDGCLLEQSIDGGLTWTTAFDYSQCNAITGSVTNIDIQVGIDYIQVLNNNWNIDVEIIYQNIKADDFDTNTVYCLGLKIFYYAVMSGIIERVKRGNNRDLITQAMAVGVATVTAFVVGTPLTGILVGIGGAVSLIAQDVINLYDENDLVLALNNESIFNEIVCCAYNNIEDVKIGFVDFQGMFDGCTGLSTQAQEIIPLFQEVVNTFDVFLTWLDAINMAYEASQSNALPNLCDICTDEWCFEFDFTVGDGGFNAEFRGEWQSGIGWVNTADSRSGVNANGLFIDIPITPDTTVLDIELEYSMLSLHPNKVARALARDGTTTLLEASSTSNGDNLVITDVGTFSAIDNLAVNIDINTSTDNPDPGQYGIAKRLKVSGTGICPFGLSNC